MSICTPKEGFSVRLENKQTPYPHEQQSRECFVGLLDKIDNHKRRNKAQKCVSKKIKRGNKKNKVHHLNIFSANAAQLRGKFESFSHELKVNNASVFTLQETHFSKKGQIKVENYEIFEAIRSKAKGGTAMGVHKGLKPVLIKEYSEDFELLVVEIKAATK